MSKFKQSKFKGILSSLNEKSLTEDCEKVDIFCHKEDTNCDFLYLGQEGSLDKGPNEESQRYCHI